MGRRGSRRRWGVALVTLAILVTVALFAAGTAGAISLSDSNVPEEAEAGETVDVTVTIEDPFVNMTDAWTLTGNSELVDGTTTWTVTVLQQGEQVSQNVYEGQNFTQELTVENGGDTVEIRISGDAPSPAGNWSYDPPQEFTLYEIDAVSGNVRPELGSATVHYYTNASQNAREAIDSAAQRINETDADGEAQNLLDDAISSYNSGNFGNAQDLAEQAENAADGSATPSATPSQDESDGRPSLFPIAAGVVLIGLFGGFALWRSKAGSGDASRATGANGSRGRPARPSSSGPGAKPGQASDEPPATAPPGGPNQPDHADAPGRSGGPRRTDTPSATQPPPGSRSRRTTANSHWHVPDRIPRAPDISVDYDALTDEQPIGTGGNADVTRATLPTRDGEVTLAIKKPRMSGTLHTETVERLLEEAETWDRLDDHDHIVGVVDYGSEPLPWIAMEYMDAGHLGDRAGDLDLDQALWTAIAVTRAVRHAHRRGVAHLDLKPANVLFRSVEGAWDVPKVGDWGLSKHLLEHSKSVEGMTVEYAAPEQFDDSYGPTDDITDVYQLGAVFYALFTGRPPFQGQPFEVIDGLKNDQPTPPSEVPDLPPGLDDVLLTALAKERADRYESVLLLRNALQDIYDDY